ncbi:hypothetical protein Q7A53_16970 [Halobacillus rhizosphaerae]|uniref:hypothetical protein n=1 Tax=Halobacillus rhizosphaerae TaxID=3064889 RepID=UPI00398A6AF0
MRHLIKRDLLLLFSSNLYKWIAAIGLTIFITSVSLYNLNHWFQLHDYQNIQASLTDVLFLNFKGTAPTDKELPYVWLLVQLYGVFLVGNFTEEDFKENGPYIISRSSRGKWWMSKTLSIGVLMFVYYGVLVLVTLLLSSFYVDLSFNWSTYGNKMIVPLLSTSIHPFLFVLVMVGLLYTGNLLLTFLLMTLLARFSSIYSFLIVVVILFSSLFIHFSGSPAMHSIILRQGLFNEQLPGIAASFIYNIGISIGICLAGGLYFRKIDIDKE